MSDEKETPPSKDSPPPEAEEEQESLDEGMDDEDWDDGVDPLASAEDAIDPELLALADERPPPRWHRPLIMVVVCGLIIVMMGWFRAELVFIFSPDEVIELGEGHAIEFRDDLENRYVQLEAVPLAPRNQNPAPQCGNKQGFPTYQRRFLCRGHLTAFPVMGRPEHDLLIQRYTARQVRIHYSAPEDREAAMLEEVLSALRVHRAVHDVRRAEQSELGKVIVDIEATAGQSDMGAITNALKFQLESRVAGIERVRVERVNRELPGNFEGRLMKIGSLGSRFASVADYLNECTNIPVDENTWVLLDGSEAGGSAMDNMGICYGHRPAQYWPYLVLYVIMGLILVLNIFLLVRFFLQLRRS